MDIFNAPYTITSESWGYNTWKQAHSVHGDIPLWSTYRDHKEISYRLAIQNSRTYNYIPIDLHMEENYGS